MIFILKLPIRKNVQRDVANKLLEKTSGKFISKSYSDRFVALAISDENQIHVDIEYKRSLNDQSKKVLKKFMFTENSLTYLSLQKSSQILMFWTIKEVYSKMSGLGLLLNFHNILINKINNHIYEVSYCGYDIVNVYVTETAEYFVSIIKEAREND